MNDKRITLLAALAGFGGGLAVGLLMTSRAGTEMRAAIEERMRIGARLLDEQVRSMEGQLHELERVVHQYREEVRARLRGSESAREEADEWELTHGEVARELPHMPRGSGSRSSASDQ